MTRLESTGTSPGICNFNFGLGLGTSFMDSG